MYLGLNVMNADARVEELFANKRPPAVGTVTVQTIKSSTLFRGIKKSGQIWSHYFACTKVAVPVTRGAAYWEPGMHILPPTE